jgi:hypothetical protein
MNVPRLVAGIVVGALATFALVTWLALEGPEVVVLRTLDEHGAVRETRTWIAEEDGALWIEAANPARPFLRDLSARPDAGLVRGDHVLRCRAVAEPNPEGHARIRRLLGARYGWADRWIDMLTDTNESVAVRLTCESP